MHLDRRAGRAGSALPYLALSLFVSGCDAGPAPQQGAELTAQAPEPARPPLDELVRTRAYRSWSAVRLHSRSLGHERTIYYRPGSAVVVSETGPADALVIEVIDAGATNPGDVFGLFSPSGERLAAYPAALDFPIAGVLGGASGTSAPDVCLTCHFAERPLILPIPATPEAAEQLNARVATGDGMPLRLRPAETEDPAGLEALRAFLRREQPTRTNDPLAQPVPEGPR